MLRKQIHWVQICALILSLNFVTDVQAQSPRRNYGAIQYSESNSSSSRSSATLKRYGGVGNYRFHYGPWYYNRPWYSYPPAFQRYWGYSFGSGYYSQPWGGGYPYGGGGAYAPYYGGSPYSGYGYGTGFYPGGGYAPTWGPSYSWSWNQGDTLLYW